MTQLLMKFEDHTINPLFSKFDYDLDYAPNRLALIFILLSLTEGQGSEEEEHV